MGSSMGQGKAAGGTKGIHPGHLTGAGIRTGPRDSPPPGPPSALGGASREWVAVRRWRKFRRNEQWKECPEPLPRPGHRSTWTRLNATPRGVVSGLGVDGADVRAGRRRIGPHTMPAAVSAGIETGRGCDSSGSANLALLRRGF